MKMNDNKYEFINEYMTKRIISETSLVALFKKIEPFEIKYGKDCSEFDVDEILDMYMDFEAKSIDVLLNYNSMLKAYSLWRSNEKNIESINGYSFVTQEMIEPIVPSEFKKLLSRKDIIDIENQLLNWTDKAIVECLWEGIAGNSMMDLVSLSKDMIDEQNNLLILNDEKSVALTPRLEQLLNQAFDETEYLCYGPTGRTKRLVGVGSLYKERDNVHAADSGDKYFRWVYRKIRIYKEHVNLAKLTMKNITTSGMFYYLTMEMERTGLDMKSYLQTDEGDKLMAKYGYVSTDRVANVTHRYLQFMK